MEVVFDPEKNDRNIRHRGLAFNRAADLDWETAWIRTDDRFDYGEQRLVAIGSLEGRLHVLVFKETMNGIRVISFRRANPREVERYEQAKTHDR